VLEEITNGNDDKLETLSSSMKEAIYITEEAERRYDEVIQ